MDAQRERYLTWEVGGYALAVALALALRLTALGHAPLSDAEATEALRALHLSRGQAVGLGPAPLYTLWTAAVFFLFGATDFTARLVPALLGGLVVGLPYFWRRWLGREAALGLAFVLAFDPALVAVGRMAAGAAPAVTLTLAAFTWALYRRWPATVLTAGLALFAGPETWLGVLGLLLAVGLGRRGRVPLLEAAGEASAPAGWLWGSLAWLLAVTLLGAVPVGVGGLTQGVVAFAQGWLHGGSVPWWVPLTALALAIPLAWGLLLLGLAYERAPWLRGDWRWGAALWAGAALLWAALYPGRQPWSAVWAAVPLWALAVDAFRRLGPGELSWPVAAHGAVVFGLSVYLGLSVGLGWQRGQGLLVAVLALMAVVLIAVATFWVAYTATPRQSWRGLALGLSLALALWTLRSTAQVVAAPEGTLLGPPQPADPQVRLLQRTVAEVAEWNHGRADTLEVVLLEAPSVWVWAFRNVRGVREGAVLGPTDAPEAILTAAEVQDLGRGVGYRGQDFLWARDPLWVRLKGADWVRWALWGQAPLSGERCILWVRVDRFPGGVLEEHP